MADRFWTPGSAANWGDANVWATTKGGDPTGIATPTSADDVYFTDDDVNNCTIGAAANCLDLDFTGYTGTLAGSSNLFFYGSAVFDSAMTNSFTGEIRFQGTSAKTFTSDGIHFDSALIINGTGTLTLQDAIYVTKAINVGNGTFTTNGYAVTALAIQLGVIFADSTINLGASAITITAVTGAAWSVGEFMGTVTLNAGTSTIKFTGALTGDILFTGLGRTYNNIWNATTGAHSLVVLGSNTFNDIKSDAARLWKFTASTTQTATTWTGSGTVGNLVTLRSTTTTNATLAKAGGGVISLDYMDVDYITGSPADTWYMGANSTDGTHNSQIYFTAAPSSTSIKTVFGTPIAEIKTINGVAIADVKSWLGVSNVD